MELLEAKGDRRLRGAPGDELEVYERPSRRVSQL